MRGMNPHLDKFLENCREAKARIESDEGLMELIEKTRGDNESCDVGRGLFSKYKNGFKGATECCVAADVYALDIPGIDFVVVVDDPSFGWEVRYLVPFFDGLTDLSSRKDLVGKDNISNQVKALQEYLALKGYIIAKDDIYRPFGVMGTESEKIVMHDLDHNSFTTGSTTASDIERGIMGRGGSYAHLEKIYDILTSDRYRLNI